MNRYPTHLAFDRSKSAIIRLKGRNLAQVVVHWAKDYGIPQSLLVCPDSVGMDGPSCKLCKSKPLLLDGPLVALVAALVARSVYIHGST